MAFWIATMAQPCDTGQAAQQSEASTAVSTLGAGDHPASPNHPHDPVPVGTHCPDLTAMAAAAPSVAIPAASSLDSPRPAASVAGAATMRPALLAPAPRSLAPPPPRASRYLRNQRLLI
jgi:hypothetical protein